MKKLKKKVTRSVVVVVTIACAVCIAYIVQRVMTSMARRKVSGTWNGNRNVDGDEINYSFTLYNDGTYDYKECSKGSLNRMLTGTYTFKDNWVVMQNGSNPSEVLEYWYKGGTLFNDGTAYTK